MEFTRSQMTMTPAFFSSAALHSEMHATAGAAQPAMRDKDKAAGRH